MGLSTAVGLGFGAANVAASSYASYQQAKAQSQAAEWNAKVMEQQALYYDMAADDSINRGKGEAAIQVLAARQNRELQRSNYAASGVLVDTGSAATVIADKAAWDEYDRQQIIANSEREAWGYRVEAANQRSQATLTRNTKQNPWVAATTTALNGGSSLFGQYHNYTYKK